MKKNYKRIFSQNFLNNIEIVKNIVDKMNLFPNTQILEIGPGQGAITNEFLKRGHFVYAIEIDEKLYNFLSKNHKNNENFIIKKQDFLESDFKEIYKNFNKDKEIIVFSSIPYHLTNKILEKILKEDNKSIRKYFIVQKEVALKIVNNQETLSNHLNFLIKYKTNKAEYLLDINKEQFYPSPKVDSSLIGLVGNKKEVDLESKEQIILQMLQNKRKLLINNNQLDLDIEKILEKLKIDSNIRVENITYEEFEKIYEEIKNV